jgi:hypothetical protein
MQYASLIIVLLTMASDSGREALLSLPSVVANNDASPPPSASIHLQMACFVLVSDR